jgi:hypothetical protein
VAVGVEHRSGFCKRDARSGRVRLSERGERFDCDATLSDPQADDHGSSSAGAFKHSDFDE